MALDYSKLTDEELDAIANDDYSKLSDRTLRELTRDPAAQQLPPGEQPEVNLLPQAVSAVAGAVPEVANTARQVGAAGAARTATANVRDAVKVGGMLSQMPMGEFMQKPITNTAKTVGAYVAGHPYVQAAGNVARGVGNVGGALVRGAVAPESVFLLPYQMAAYEQEKIRQNPNAPGLEFNPYAQTVRGEYATQGQAGAANARRAVINAPYGNVTPEERALLDEDKKNKMRILMQYEAAKRVLGQQQ